MKNRVKKQGFQDHYQKQVKMFVFTSWLVFLGVNIYAQYFFGVVGNKRQALTI